ncbi:MAG: SDR family oxidoreductase [Micromonosporaceae bacterium]
MTILITGATGYLGRRIAGRLLVSTDEPLILAVRAADRAELARRDTELRSALGDGTALAGRVEVVPVELGGAPEPFGAVDPGRVTVVVHAAARTDFTVSQSDARRVNVDGTRQVAEFARRCPRLRRLLVLSTLFSAGRQVGVVPEAPHPADPGFVNAYEWSKHRAETVTAATGLPLTIARLATVVADDDTGAVVQHNAFHNTLKLLFYGLLSLLPGDPRTRLCLATAEFTSRGVAWLARPETPGGIYHLAPSPLETTPVGELVELAYQEFEADPGFARRRLLRPEFCDLASFRDLTEAAGALSASPMAQALGSVAPFAEQLFLPKEFDNRRLRAVWPAYPATAPRPLARAVCRRLVRTRWGRTTTEEVA